MEFIEYPKSLYLSGWKNLDETVTVWSKSEETQARKKGYKMLDESDPAEDLPPDVPLIDPNAAPAP